MAKSICPAGWEAHFNGDRQCEDFIATQISNKKTIEGMWLVTLYRIPDRTQAKQVCFLYPRSGNPCQPMELITIN